MKELLLLRHAKAKLIEDGIEDKERPLKKRGKRDSRNIGVWLKKQNLLPDVLLSSTAKRAIETARIVHQELDIKDLVIQKNEQLYATNVEQFRAILGAFSEDVKRILLVGHNPELEDFLIHLVGKEALPDVKKLLPTAALVRLSISENTAWCDLNERCAQFLSVTCAKSLSEYDAKTNDLDGS
jgi:phosphohistidine phosphatase